VLVQLRTGMARLNDYLHQIQAAPSDLCACGRAEKPSNISFSPASNGQSSAMLECTTTQKGNLSYYLGGKTRSDKHDWEPDMRAVRATIRVCDSDWPAGRQPRANPTTNSPLLSTASVAVDRILNT